MTDNRWQRMLPGAAPVSKPPPGPRPAPKTAPIPGPFTAWRDDAGSRMLTVRGYHHVVVMRVEVLGNANVSQFQKWLVAALNDKFNVEQAIARNAAAFTGDKS